MVWQITLHSHIMKINYIVTIITIYDIKHGYIKVNTLFRGLLSVTKTNYAVYYMIILHIF